MDCNYCTDVIIQKGRDTEVVHDQEGNPYHPDCALIVQNKFDWLAQEEQVSQEARAKAASEYGPFVGDY